MKPFIQQFREAVRDTDIPSTDKLVLRTMADYANSAGQNVKAALNTLAKGSGISRRTCVYAVKRLAQSGWLERVTPGKPPSTPTEYRLLMGAPYSTDYSDGARNGCTDYSDKGVNGCTKQHSMGARMTPVTRVSITSASKHAGTSSNEDAQKLEPLRGLCGMNPDLDEYELSLILPRNLVQQYAALDCGHLPVSHELDSDEGYNQDDTASCTECSTTLECSACSASIAACFCDKPIPSCYICTAQSATAGDMF